MAKQSGLHQLRGKVGEHSYYRQTGVASGLVRSINQGMSQRVKTSDEYANVRLNNSEFGQAGRIAKVLGELITPKYRPMLLPFSQSKMCKALLASIKSDTTNPWGGRNIPTTVDGAAVLVEALNSVRKNNPDDYGVSIFIEDDLLHVKTDIAITTAKQQAIGADGYEIRVVAACPWIGKSIGSNYADSFARFNLYTIGTVGPDEDDTIDYEFKVNPPVGSFLFQQNFFVVIIMPYRTINNVNYILQETCTYFASEVPESN